MPDPNARELKLIQYLNEAYGKEKELETALKAHISMTTRAAYKKRLQDHLKETKAQARNLERRVKQLGGTADAGNAVAEAVDTATSVAKKGVSLAKGPLHALRGTGEAEKMLKNAKTEFFNEHEEIATYNGIEALAEALGDQETVKLAREHRRQEERMAKFLDKEIPKLAKAVVAEEIPASERKPQSATGTKRSSSSRSTSSRSRSRSTASKASSSSGGRSRSAASKSGSGTSRSRSASTASKSSSGRS